MTLLFAVAELADAVTMRLDNEFNPLVVSMGAGAYLAKAALIVLVVAVTYLLRLPGDPRYPRLRALRSRVAAGILWGGAVWGAFGAWTNIG